MMTLERRCHHALRSEVLAYGMSAWEGSADYKAMGVSSSSEAPLMSEHVISAACGPSVM